MGWEGLNEDTQPSAVRMSAHLLVVYIFLVIFESIVAYVDMVVLLKRTGPLMKIIHFSALAAMVDFLFIFLPLICVIKRNGGFLLSFFGAAFGLAIYSIVQVGTIGLTGGTLVRHGLTFFDRGGITLWGLAANVSSIVAMSFWVAVSMQISKKWSLS